MRKKSMKRETKDLRAVKNVVPLFLLILVYRMLLNS
jgi:hypothetical protein